MLTIGTFFYQLQPCFKYSMFQYLSKLRGEKGDILKRSMQQWEIVFLGPVRLWSTKYILSAY